MEIPKELIMETNDGYHYLRNDINYIPSEPIDAEFAINPLIGKWHNGKLLAILSLRKSVPFEGIGTKIRPSWVYCRVKEKIVERELNEKEMEQYLIEQCNTFNRVVYLKIDGVKGIRPYYKDRNFEYTANHYQLTFDGIKFFSFPKKKI